MTRPTGAERYFMDRMNDPEYAAAYHEARIRIRRASDHSEIVRLRREMRGLFDMLHGCILIVAAPQIEWQGVRGAVVILSVGLVLRGAWDLGRLWKGGR